MNILKNINQYLNWRNIRFISFVIIGLFFTGELGFANENNTTTVVTSSAEGDVQWVVDLLIRLPSIILGFLTYFVGLFLNPGWVNGEIFNLGQILKDLWIMVSNVVYLIFAFILIIIAFMNIIGKGEGTWELKQALPKLIIGVLIVPFSWFFVQLIISLSSILTVSILSLPFDSFDAHTANTALKESGKNEEDKIPTQCTINLGGLESEDEESDENKEKFFKCDEESEKYVADIISSIGEDGDSIFGIMFIYTYGVMGLHKAEDLEFEKITTAGGVKSVTDLITSLGFSAIFIIVYTILMIALFMALLSRGVYLWIYMIFSPVFGLMYFFGGSAPGELGEKFSIKEFISLAMVPVLVAAALSFGLLFLAIAGKAMEKPNSDYFNADGSLQVGQFQLQINGGEEGSWLGIFGTTKDTIGSVLGKLIIQMFGLAILWIGVMAALKSSKITGGVIEPIASFGNSVGELIAKSPQYAPIIPTSNGMMSSAALNQAGSTFKTAVAGQHSERGTKFGNRVANAVGVGESDIRDLSTAMSGLETSLVGVGTSLENKKEGYKKLIDHADVSKFDDRAYKEKFVSYLEKIFGAENIEKYKDSILKATPNNISEKIASMNATLDSNVVNSVFGSGFSRAKNVEDRLNKGVKTNNDNTPPQNTTSDKTININLATSEIKNHVNGNGDIVPDGSGTKANSFIDIAKTVIDDNKKNTITESQLRDDLGNIIQNSSDLDSVVKAIKEEMKDFFKE